MSRAFPVKLKGLEGALDALETYNEVSRTRINRAVELTTNSVFRKIRRGMRGAKSGEVYERRGKDHRASAPGEPPAIMTRQLFRSLFKDFRPFRGEVGTKRPEGLWLEFGARKGENNPLAARPWLRPAVRGENRSWRIRMFRALKAAERAARRTARER